METSEIDQVRKDKLAAAAAKKRAWRAAKRAALQTAVQKAPGTKNKKEAKVSYKTMARDSKRGEQKIKLLTPENPKRPGSDAHVLFARYKDGMTVDQYVAAGGRLDAVRWDVKHKFIALK